MERHQKLEEERRAHRISRQNESIGKKSWGSVLLSDQRMKDLQNSRAARSARGC